MSEPKKMGRPIKGSGPRDAHLSVRVEAWVKDEISRGEGSQADTITKWAGEKRAEREGA